jgi:hypothetical protein
MEEVRYWQCNRRSSQGDAIQDGSRATFKERDITKWWLVMMPNLKLVHIKKVIADEVPEMNQAMAKKLITGWEEKNSNEIHRNPSFLSQCLTLFNRK